MVRTARYHVLGDPAAADEVWFVLHGYGQLAGRFIRRFESLPGLASGARAVVAPEALSRFYVESRAGAHGPGSRVGAAWMTREAREEEIRDYVEYLDAVALAVLSPGAGGVPGRRGGAGPGVVVLGFSQGAETASRWAVLGSVAARELILWGGGLAADLDPAVAAAALGEVAVRFVVGDQDGWAGERAAAGEAMLREQGLAPGRVDYAGGHRIEAEVLARHWPDQRGIARPR